jgi:hypothetical protein
LGGWLVDSAAHQAPASQSPANAIRKRLQILAVIEFILSLKVQTPGSLVPGNSGFQLQITRDDAGIGSSKAKQVTSGALPIDHPPDLALNSTGT